MKLLIITQKIDTKDGVLGFFARWVEEFALHCDFVTIVCLEKGNYNFLDKVQILSLGKETGKSKLKYIYRLYKYIWGERKKYDVVFVHMNTEYVLLGGLLWKMLGKKIYLWYAHGRVNWMLRIAEKFVNAIFTSTKSGCRLHSAKIKVVGQGIDVNYFQPLANPLFFAGRFKILSVGRLSPVKDYPTLFKAVGILAGAGIPLEVNIIGSTALPEQKEYLDFLKNLVSELGLTKIVKFLGDVPNVKILPYLQSNNLFVNMSHTGSLDKAILEAMAVGLPVLTCNEALKEVLGNYVDILMYPKGDYKQLADKIRFIINLPPEKRSKMVFDLRNLVIKNHNIKDFVNKIVNHIHHN